MQVVDVLRDYGGRLAGAVEARERKVAAARLGGGELRVHGKSPPPRLVPHLLAREELVERDRPVLRPEPAGRAEIGDTALGGNAGAGERSYDARALYQVLQFVDGGLQIRRDHVCCIRSMPSVAVQKSASFWQSVRSADF